MGILSIFRREKKSLAEAEKKQPPVNVAVQHNLSKDLSRNIEMVKSIMGNPSDILVREFVLSSDSEVRAAVIALAGLSKSDLINEQILGTLMQNTQFKGAGSLKGLFEQIRQHGIPNITVREEIDSEKVVDELISGNSVIFIDGIDKSLAVASPGWQDRQVSQPITENVIRGPRDGFTENIEVNIALIRRRIKSHSLRIESFRAGRETKTDITIVYLTGVVNEKVVEEVRTRINKIDIDGILESGYVEELIEDNSFSPFPLMEHSERPDKVSAEILEGRVAILVDTTPFVLMVPTVFLQFLQSADDYYDRYLIGTLTRGVRIIAYFISVVLPALYIALTSFHQEMIPTTLALSLAASREGVPFPSIGEVLIMEVIFEIMREAGLRLPQQTGQAVSIVGGLVIGQAAVQAGLSIILIHMSSLRSFGVGYLEPFVAPDKNLFNDTIVRNPWWSMFHLPSMISHKRLALRPF